MPFLSPFPSRRRMIVHVEGHPSGQDRGSDQRHGLCMAVPKDKDASVPKAEISAGATESQRKGRVSRRDKDGG